MSWKRLAIVGLITLAAAIGISGTVLQEHEHYVAVELTLSGLLIIFLLIWVHHDSIEAHYVRPRLLTAGLFALPIVFLPVYLFLSRPRPHNFFALLKCFAFFAMLLLVAAASALVAALIWYL